jgi:predicted enzyme related to lactoylglutathione lyase
MMRNVGTHVVPEEENMSGESNRGRFVWYDLMTSDSDAAKTFYTGVMGWGTEVWENPGMSYTMWKAGETPIGGIMKRPEQAGGAPPQWLAYVAVPDVDATTSRAQELGGKVIVPPTDIPTVGRFSVIADPQGATMAPFTPQPQSGGPERPEQPPVGDFSWHELATPEPEAVFDFYADLFGWQKTSAMDMGPMGVYQMFGRGGAPLGGIYRKPETLPGPPAWLHYARVADVNAATEAVRQHGGKVINGPMEVPGGDWITMVLDPQGGPFAVHEVKSAQS